MSATLLEIPNVHLRRHETEREKSVLYSRRKGLHSRRIRLGV